MVHDGSPPWLDYPRKFLKLSTSETLKMAFPRFLSIKLERVRHEWNSAMNGTRLN